MKWTKARQDAVRETHKRAVLNDLVWYIEDHADAIIALADTRHEGGFQQYGEEMFTWDRRSQELAIREELADAVNYGCAMRARGWSL